MSARADRQRALVECLRSLQPWQRHAVDYQSCRFCKASPSHLWKYGVRHYACDSCRLRLTAGQVPPLEKVPA